MLDLARRLGFAEEARTGTEVTVGMGESAVTITLLVVGFMMPILSMPAELAADPFAEIGTGSVFGELSAIDGGGRTADALLRIKAAPGVGGIVLSPFSRGLWRGQSFAFLATLPVAYHCLWSLGFNGGHADTRVLVHSIAVLRAGMPARELLGKIILMTTPTSIAGSAKA